MKKADPQASMCVADEYGVLNETIVGKGTFVSNQNTERLKEITLYNIENKLEEIIQL